VYLIFPLAGEQGTVQVVQRTLLLGGVALAIALTGISALVAMQVVRPVRRAAASARKLAAGDLAERMPVKGPIELETLASSFNGMAEAIRVQIRQLEEFGKLQRRFTSDVSHELRTPLTTVRMAADMLYDGRGDFPEYLGRSTELLVDELDRFESLLADLLEISRYDAGMAELSAESIDIRSCIHASISAAASLADQFDIQIVTILPEHPVIAEIDNRRVDRILRNLINNAIDHADGKPVEVELAAEPEVLAITVTDHGVGLRPGEAGLVFNRFWRADPSRQRHTGGTGLGLAISLEDARLHGGWLQASGTPGEGARFRLTLPRRHGGLITHSPLPLRVGADVLESPAVEGHQPVRMMVEDGTLKPAPSEDELHPASVPLAGATATLTVAGADKDEDSGEAQRSPVARSAGTSDVPAHSPVNR
jgi:two-component system sensor histidine kinase MtrB